MFNSQHKRYKNCIGTLLKTWNKSNSKNVLNTNKRTEIDPLKSQILYNTDKELHVLNVSCTFIKTVLIF